MPTALPAIALLTITLISVVAAIAALLVAWRVTREARLRSDARVAALARAIHPVPAADSYAAPVSDVSGEELPAVRVPFILTAGVVVVAAVIALVLAVSAGGRSSAAGHAEAGAQRPLELLQLGHDRVAGTLTIRGTIRNPPENGELRAFTVSAVLLDDAGHVLETGLAAVGDQDLVAGERTGFTIGVPDHPDGGRFRISFRTADRTTDRIVPHVDLRKGLEP